MLNRIILVSLAASTASARYDTARLPIFAGEPASENDMGATVAIVDANDGAQYCTGTLIGPSVVVTAAHCFVTNDQETGETNTTEADAVDVVYGVLDSSEASAEQRRRATRLLIHTAYPRGEETSDPSGMGRDDDIALVVLDAPITDHNVAPILPADQVDAVLTEGAELLISGYGTREPGGQESGVLYMASTSFKRRSDYEFFAGGQGESDTCPGDSGGPVYVQTDAGFFVVGVTSRGGADAQVDCGEGGVYALLPAYIGWATEEASAAGASIGVGDGADGADATDGADGADATDGADGADGADARDGADGADARDGADGADGEVSATDEGDDAACTAGRSGQLPWVLPLAALVLWLRRREA